MPLSRTKSVLAAAFVVPMSIALAACSSGAQSAPATESAPAPAQTMQTMAERSHITTHILDTGTGKPSPGVAVKLEAKKGDSWEKIAEGVTDNDGRINNLGPKSVEPGAYRTTYQTEDYFKKQNVATFYPSITIDFYVTSTTDHYHVPLLLSPFAYSTYRGS